MKRVLAISGGVDSMVMLEIFLQKYPVEELVVAHFNHGIRKNAGDDAAFVERICKERGVEFVLGVGELGAEASEAEARTRRYQFLHAVAAQYGAGTMIYTAHHLDDLVESVAINLLRGTGWRGVAVLGGQPQICRPLLQPKLYKVLFTNPPTKHDLVVFAAQNQVVFREDQSNNTGVFLRNRVRESLKDFPLEQKLKLYKVWRAQQDLRAEIEPLVQELLPKKRWERAWFWQLDAELALELLKAGLERAGVPATRPQIEDFRQAILNYGAKKQFNLPSDRLVRLEKDWFELY